MKRIIKYLVPLIISFVALCAGLFLYFFCAPQNAAITSEIIKISETPQRVGFTYPFTYKITYKITANIFSDKEVDEKLNFVVTYTTASGKTEQGSFYIDSVKEGTNLIQNKIFGYTENTRRDSNFAKINKLEAYFESTPDEVFEIKQRETSTFGRSASYLIFAGAGICLSVFAVLIAYELVSPVRNPERKIIKLTALSQNTEDDKERKRIEQEIEKLKLENEKLKLEKEILEKNNKKVVCEHCGMETSSKNEICPGCKAPLKTK